MAAYFIQFQTRELNFSFHFFPFNCLHSEATSDNHFHENLRQMLNASHCSGQCSFEQSSVPYLITLPLFNHFHHNRETGCGGARTAERGSKLSAPFYPPNHGIAQETDHNTGNYMPYSLRQVLVFPKFS